MKLDQPFFGTFPGMSPGASRRRPVSGHVTHIAFGRRYRSTPRRCGLSTHAIGGEGRGVVSFEVIPHLAHSLCLQNRIDTLCVCVIRSILNEFVRKCSVNLILFRDVC
ncbi:hypothetical protein CDAR_524681 [Caerostris darwini]|uniref:Uncharacterized protein n=1 Tax=Caerostris darwini TaxID=1538125 RepID=A0AAV4QYH0_9ARAC|nr:hypothetical protein CDAR_524681 [Caerostris darwini]